MKKELDVWQFAAAKLKSDEAVILLVVAASAGSSPGRQGFKMVVAADDLRGSVGGGAMEIRLVEQAKLKIQNSKFKAEKSKTELIEQVHRKNAIAASGMICSGRQTVIFYRLDSRDLQAIEKIAVALENHQSAVLRISGSAFEIVENARAEFDFQFERTSENEFLYEEKLGYKNKLSIVGGGHCALALAELMSKMDFFVELFDDRPNLNTFVENQFAHRKDVVENYACIDQLISPGANHFVVVMTVGYKTDEVVVRRLLDKNFKYFGVLGSEAKIKTLLKTLEKEGFDRSRLNQIRAPVGLQINSRTPEEIAVSIAAEIIDVKNAKD